MPVFIRAIKHLHPDVCTFFAHLAAGMNERSNGFLRPFSKHNRFKRKNKVPISHGHEHLTFSRLTFIPIYFLFI